tara:strand:- start:557 stop:1786 length:1230 start_codon:yes stop_codon:yes gene_type:complete
MAASELLNRLDDLGFREHSVESLELLKKSDPEAIGAKWASGLVRRMRLEIVRLEHYRPDEGATTPSDAAAAESEPSTDAGADGSAANAEFLRTRGVLVRSDDTAFDVLQTMVAVLQAERMRASNAVALEALAAHTRPPTPPSHAAAAAAEFRAELLQLCAVLNVPHLSAETDEAIAANVAAQLAKRRSAATDGPIFARSTATPAQMKRLVDINRVLRDDFALRRKLILERVDVTIQSFLWSQRGKENAEAIHAAIRPLRSNLEATPTPITTDHVFEADAALVRSTTAIVSSAGAGASSAASRIKSVVMGAVPDRGGRPGERRPGKESMPGWSKRRAGGGGRRGGRRGGGKSGKGGRGRGGGGRGGGGGGKKKKKKKGGRGRGGGGGGGGGGSGGGGGGGGGRKWKKADS